MESKRMFQTLIELFKNLMKLKKNTVEVAVKLQSYNNVEILLIQLLI